MSFDDLFGGQVYRTLPSSTTSSNSLDPFQPPWEKPVYRSLGTQSDSDIMPTSSVFFNQPRIRTMSTAPGTGVPFSSPSTVIPDVSSMSRSLSNGSSLHSGTFSLDTPDVTPVSRSPGVEKLFQSAAASSSNPLSLALNSSGVTKPASSTLAVPSLARKTSAPNSEHKFQDPRTVWSSFRVGTMFIRCIVHPIHVCYLLCAQLSTNEWQVIEYNQENRKCMIQGTPLKRSTYVFNEKHKIELCSLGELNTLVPSVKPSFGGRNGFGGDSDFSFTGQFGRTAFGEQSSAFEELGGDLRGFSEAGFSEDLDLRMTLND